MIVDIYYGAFDSLLLLGKCIIQGKTMKLRLESMSFLKKQFNGMIVRERVAVCN